MLARLDRDLGDFSWNADSTSSRISMTMTRAVWSRSRGKRYFNINWIQMVTTWAAFTLFLVGLGSL